MFSVDTMYGTNLAIWSLLLAFGISLVVAAILGLRTWLGYAEKYRWLGFPCRLAAAFLASVLSVDAIVSTSKEMSSARHFVFSLLAVGAAVVVTALHRPFSALVRSPRARSRTVSQGLLIATFLASAYWSGHRVYHTTLVTLDLGLFVDTPGTLSELPGVMLVTDRGRALPVFRWDVEHDAFEYYAALSEARLGTLHQAIILRAPPDARANCHGWVFTGGAHLLRGREVAELLADNGYQVVDRPLVDDLVIYRNRDGVVLHTGLVRGILDDGTVLVESKWGVDGRYLHRPEDQPYSTEFSYYRSPRAGHLVALRSPDALPELNRPVASTRIEPSAM